MENIINKFTILKLFGSCVGINVAICNHDYKLRREILLAIFNVANLFEILNE